MSFSHVLKRVSSDLRQGVFFVMHKQFAATRMGVPGCHASLVRRTTTLSLSSTTHGAVSLYVWTGWQPRAQERIFLDARSDRDAWPKRVKVHTD